MTKRRTIKSSISDSDRFGMTFFLAVIFHGLIILGVTFTVTPAADSKTSPALDIILVQTKSPTKVDQAKYLAQISQQGGGEQKDESRARELFSAATLSDTSGMTAQPSVARTKKQKQNEKLTLLTNDDAEHIINTDDTPVKKDDDSTIDNIDTKQINTQTARLAAEISTVIEKQASVNRTKYLNSSTQEFTPAKYMRDWINWVERVGNLNYPDQARRKKLSGTLILDVVIDADGNLIKTEIRQSSGHQILDDAAKRIVKLAAPFSAFPDKLREEADVIHITRSWEFLSNSSIRTH